MDAITSLKIKNEKDAYGALLSVLGPNHCATLESAARITDILTYEYRYRKDDRDASSLLKDIKYYGEIAYNGLIKRVDESEYPIGSLISNYSGLLLEVEEFEQVLSVAEDSDKIKLRDFDYENWFEVSANRFMSLTQLGRFEEAETKLEEVQEEIIKERGYYDFRFGKTFLLYYLCITKVKGNDIAELSDKVLSLMEQAGCEDTVSYHIIAVIRDVRLFTDEAMADLNSHLLALGKVATEGGEDEDEHDFCMQCLVMFLPYLPPELKNYLTSNF